jgi:hypothetical protein
MRFDISSSDYTRAWLATLPVLMSVQVAAALEAYTKLTTQYPGLGGFASRLLRWCLALLAISSCISIAWDFNHFTQSLTQAVYFAGRYFAFVLAGCLALPCLVLWRFPKPDKQPARNITVHLWMLVSYFCVYIVSFLSVNVLGIHETTITIINVITTSAFCGLYASWAFLLTPEGEASVQWPKLETDLLALIDTQSDIAFQRGERLRRSRPE